MQIFSNEESFQIVLFSFLRNVQDQLNKTLFLIIKLERIHEHNKLM